MKGCFFMAYDFGAQTLGIKNPFKIEGRFKSVSGLLITLLGIYVLLQVPDNLKQDIVFGWTYAVLGFVIAASGLRTIGAGLFQLFKYFVGRSVPISLSQNYSRTEQDAASAEKDAVFYTSNELNSMLLGRKNTTFVEPKGWLSRFIHSVFPKLTFLPFPLRNMAEEIFSVVINTLTAIFAYAIASFVVISGLAGEKAEYVMLPLFSLILLIYLIGTWRSSASALESSKNYHARHIGGSSVIGLIGLSFLIPIITGFYLDKLITAEYQDTFNQFTEINIFGAWGNLSIFLITIVIVLGLILPLLLQRMKEATPTTAVSEYRDNLQENVHPKEIFINIENIILANRRVKEIPNRVYKEFNPELIKESDKKGTFNGELLIETQPELSQSDVKNKTAKSLLTLTSQIAMLVSAVLLYVLVANGLSIYEYISSEIIEPRAKFTLALFTPVITEINNILFVLFAWLGTKAVGRIMQMCSHTFWGEIHFSSLLMHLKVEGTYTESKMATGMAINDSTRSENFVVRSSITPWLITSRIDSCIFATSGANNLETPRYVMNMNKNDLEMEEIVGEIKSFLINREVIASVRNSKDLDNTMQILDVNKKSRDYIASSQISIEEQAGFVKREENETEAITSGVEEEGDSDINPKP